MEVEKGVGLGFGHDVVHPDNAEEPEMGFGTEQNACVVVNPLAKVGYIKNGYGPSLAWSLA